MTIGANKPLAPQVGRACFCAVSQFEKILILGLLFAKRVIGSVK